MWARLECRALYFYKDITAKTLFCCCLTCQGPVYRLGGFAIRADKRSTPGSGNLSFTSANVSKGSEEESTEALPGMRFHERGPRLKWHGPFLFCALTNEQICQTGSIRLAFTLDQLPMLLSFFSTIHKLTFYANRVMHFHVLLARKCRITKGNKNDKEQSTTAPASTQFDLL